jgi:N-methylhydantoinase A
MAHGGSYPTPTDALSVLGMIREGNRDFALEGIRPIADELGLPVEGAAAEIFDHVCNTILEEINDMVERLNAQPVYTIHEIRDGFRVQPKKILIIGGPAPYFARRLEELSDFKVGVVPRWEVANAIGAALARTTCEVTLFADTQLGLMVAPEENYTQQIGSDFTKRDAVEKVFDLLRKKALGQGARPDDLEMELLEELEFNMVRGFQTTGKNIRVKAQVQPGLISEYDAIADRLSG